MLKKGDINDPSIAVRLERKRAVTHLEGFRYERVKVDPVCPDINQDWAYEELLLVFTILQWSKRRSAAKDLFFIFV